MYMKFTSLMHFQASKVQNECQPQAQTQIFQFGIMCLPQSKVAHIKKIQLNWILTLWREIPSYKPWAKRQWYPAFQLAFHTIPARKQKAKRLGEKKDLCKNIII